MNWGNVRFKQSEGNKIVIIKRYIFNRVFEIVCLIFLFVLFFIDFKYKLGWMYIIGFLLVLNLVLNYPMRIKIIMDNKRNLLIEKRYPLFIRIRKKINADSSNYIRERLIGINIISLTGRNYGAYIQYKENNKDKTFKSIPIFFSFEFNNPPLKTNCLKEKEIFGIGKFLGLSVDAGKLI